VRLVELLCATGVDEIEVSSFVSPKWVPQLGDVRQVLEGLMALHVSGPLFSFLVPNDRGMEDACKANSEVMSIDKIALFTAASETFSKRNTNASIAESLERFCAVMERAGCMCGGMPLVRGYVSCAIACPFEGPIDPERVADVAAKLVELGVHEIDLGDTIGAGTQKTVRKLIDVVAGRLGRGWLGERVPEQPGLTLHLHDTFGRAADCVRTALEMGVRSFDGSVAGLGGCPYASKTLPDGTVQRAPGNISTELLLRTVHEAGYETGVDLDALGRAAEFARSIVGRSRAGTAGAGA
jgi:hydroxymethylglutaryl-CoA lyase